MKKMSILYKISYSALFIALGIILSRFLSVYALFGLSFLKISLTMSVIIFASLYLGPVFGMIVSFSIDFIGALLVPQGGAYDPLFSIPAILEGLFPWVFYYVLRKINVDKKYPILLGIIILLLDVFVLVFVLFHDTFSYTSTSKIYEFTPTLKVVIPLVFFIVSLTFYLLVIFYKNKFKDKKINNYYNLFNVASATFLTYFLIKIPISSAISMYRFEYSYEIIFATKTLAGFLTSMIHLVIIYIALDVSIKGKVKGSLIKDD